jgi:hypothetical protein
MANNAPGSTSDPKGNIADVPTISHAESSQEHANFKTAKNADGDTAMALFDDPDELHEEVDPDEARKLLWKIDFMILPYLAVCYAFFYIDKVSTINRLCYPFHSYLPSVVACHNLLTIVQTTLSYAAIFGIRDDLNLHGTQYSWLSSIFYFGFLIWAFPTNFLMQRLPIGRADRFDNSPTSIFLTIFLGKYLGVNIFMWFV